MDKEVKKRGGGGFTKLCSLSPELQKFTGVPELARTEVLVLDFQKTPFSLRKKKIFYFIFSQMISL